MIVLASATLGALGFLLGGGLARRAWPASAGGPTLDQRRVRLVRWGTAVFFAAVTWWGLAEATPGWAEAGAGGIAASVILIVALLYLAAITVVLTLIDLDRHLLPNSIVLPSYAVASVLLTASAVFSGDGGALLASGIGGAALFAFYLVLAIASPRGMGMGDVKLAGLLGLYLGFIGWGALLIGAFGAFVVGGLFAVVLLVLGKARRSSGIPFGPWMLLGAWLGIAFGEGIWAGYLGMIGLSSA